jgi:hypothetical protein
MSMEIPPGTNSGSSPSKRARAKPKIVVKSSAAAAVKKPRAARKTLTVKPAAEEVAVVTAAKPSTEDVGSMIATAAYYLAAARNFTPGHELDDWLEAERSVRAQLYG